MFTTIGIKERWSSVPDSAKIRVGVSPIWKNCKLVEEIPMALSKPTIVVKACVGDGLRVTGTKIRFKRNCNLMADKTPRLLLRQIEVSMAQGKSAPVTCPDARISQQN